MKKCKKCGNSFIGSRKTQKYCSRKCAGEIHEKNIPLIKCQICEMFFKPKTKISKYCSINCRNKASSERAIKRNYKHGMRNTRFYTIWHGIMLRCLTPTSGAYKNYGGKGIAVCEEWKIFLNFYNDMFEDYYKHSTLYGEKNTTIDRINNSKGYFKENCRWATWKKQGNNKTSNHKVMINKKEYTVSDCSEIAEISHSCMLSRIKNGITGEKLLKQACPYHKYIYNLVSPEKIKYVNISLIGIFCKAHNININKLQYAFKSNKKTYKNWEINRILKN